MTQNSHSKKQPKNAGEREDRLKAALKANMARRKAQAKARAGSDDSEPTESQARFSGQAHRDKKGQD